MFEETLSKDAKRALAAIGKSGILNDAYLAGGTALALCLGHRVSVDLDFFTRKEFNERQFVEKMNALSIGFKLERIDWRTVLGYIGKTKFSLFFYNYPLLSKTQKYSDVNIADIKDIAPMKLLAVSDRGIKRDFIDLYFIVALKKIFTLDEVFELYDQKFKTLPQNKLHILKSLSYFETAEKMPIPKMLKEVNWREVKKFFIREAKDSASRLLHR